VLSNRQARCSIVESEDFSQMTVYNYGFLSRPGGRFERVCPAGNAQAHGSKFARCHWRRGIRSSTDLSANPFDTGGMYFQRLAFLWSRAHPTSTDTCIMAETGSCSAIRCTFTDCTTAFIARAPGCALKQCTIDYTSGPGSAGPVYLGAGSAPTELLIVNCPGYSVPQKHRREDRYELTRCA